MIREGGIIIVVCLEHVDEHVAECCYCVRKIDVPNCGWYRLLF